MENRTKKLRHIVVLLVVIFVLGLVLLATMIPVHGFFTISVLAIQTIVIIYFAMLALGLIRDNAEYEQADEERRKRAK